MFTPEREYRAPDGHIWGVEVRLPGASNAMVVFHHRNGPARSRYAWYIWRGPEARSVTSRVQASKVLEAVTEAELARLFRQSMPISAGATPLTADVR